MRRFVLGFLLVSMARAQDALEEASGKLLADDPDVRLAAAGRLGALGPLAAPAVPLLAAAAYDEEDQVARAAVDALGRVGPAAGEATQGLRDLAAVRPALARVVERALRATGGGSGGMPAPTPRRPVDAAAAKELSPLVDHPQPSVRMAAIWALTLNRAADPVLVTMLEDPRVRRRRIAAQHFFGTASLPHLRRALKDEDLRVRRGVIRSLAGLGAEAAPALPDLLVTLDEGDPRLADDLMSCLASIGRTAPESVVPALLRQLGAAHAASRASACSNLARLGRHAAPAVPSLAQACFDEEPQVVSAAVGALRKLGPVAKEAAPYLAELADADPGVGELARLALRAMGGGTLPPPPDPLRIEALKAQLRDRDARAAGLAAFALGRLAAKDTETLEALAAALDHPAPYARKQAALALQRIGPAVLARVAREGRGPARRLATAALPRLANTDPEAVLPVALALFGDEDPYVRREAIRALGIIGPGAQEAATGLLECLRSDAPEVKGAAAWALGRLHADAAVPLLLGFLDLPRGDDQTLVTWALIALGEIGRGAEPALPAIVAEARRPDDTHFREAVDALVKIGAAGQAEVVALIRDEVGNNRAYAIQVLMALDLRPPGLKEALDAAMKDPDSNVRQTALLAARALEPGTGPGIGEAAAAKGTKIEALVAAALAEPADRYRWSHLPETLAEVASVAELLEVVRDQETQVRWIAWRALSLKRRADFAEADAAQALPLLLDALHDPKVSDAAALSAHVVPLEPLDPRILWFLLPGPGSRTFDSYVAEQVGRALRDRGPDIVPALTRALGHEDPRIRAGAAAVLDGFGPAARAAVPALREAALADAKNALPFVRAIIAAADLETIASLFADAAMPLRTGFGDALVAAGKDALPLLDALRQDDDPAVRRDTVVLLARCLDVPPDWVLKATGDEDDNVASAALAQLGEGVPAEKAIPILARAAQDDALRSTALRVLVARGADGLPTLAALAADPSPAVRAAALDALGGSGAAALGYLAEGLKDKEPNVRAEAASALRRLGADAAPAVPALRALLKDPDAPVRRAAAATLGRLRAEDAVPDLVALFGSAHAPDRHDAAQALAAIGGKGVTALALFLAHPDEPFRETARSALASMGAKAVPVLEALLAGEDAAARREAAGLLARVGAPAVDALRGALRDKAAGVRRDAAWALGTMKAQAAGAVPDLVAALEDPDRLVVPQAAWALGQIGPAAKEALPALEKLHAARKHGAIVADAIWRIRGS